MISRSEVNTFLENEPKFDDIMCSLYATAKQPKGILKEAKKVVAIARKFNCEVVRPTTLSLDLKTYEDPEYLPWEFVKAANEWGLYTLFIPKIFGGKGYNLSCIGYFLEEIGSVCLSMANLIGVHYLGYTMICASWNMRLINKVSREVAEGEKAGAPCLFSLAITEPDAGTDSQNIEFLDTGGLGCHAKKVDGGYVVNGAKIFISSGHLSTWHFVHVYTDLQKGSENTVMLAIKTGTKGFAFGKKEKKMGMKGCPASELIFNDCFVPDENVCIDNRDTIGLSRSIRDTNAQILAYIWGASRMGVAGFGTAAARGAFEQALKFAAENEISGKRLINHEWCQSMLAEMYKNVAVSRTAYAEVNYANGLYGLWRVLNLKPLYYITKFTPSKLIDKIFIWLCEKPFATTLFRKIMFDFQKEAEIDRIDGWGSLAKVTTTDSGLRNCQMALEIMGQAGIRHDKGMEKILRDTKLLQIYEGTNQVNRINLFKRLIARSCSIAEPFSIENN